MDGILHGLIRNNRTLILKCTNNRLFKSHNAKSSTTRRRPRGQALVLFALSLAVLLMLVGLTIDGLRIYIAIGQGQQAADAAALAGVEYLPSYPDASHADSSGNNAQLRAQQEAAKNGFTDSHDISVTIVPNKPLTLQVVIQLHITLTLTAVFNPGLATTSVTAQARMLPPIGIGDSGASFGNSNQTGMVATIVGANELKERGDAYTSHCEDGWTNAADSLHSDSTSGSPYTTRLGTSTNQIQYSDGPHCSPGTPGNADVVPSGFAGLATGTSVVPTGASYLITVPPSSSSTDVYIWNPRFSISNPSQTTAPSRFYDNENIFTTLPLIDANSYYPHIAYTLYSAPQLYNRSTDKPLATIWPYTTPPPVLAGQPSISWQPMPPYDMSFLDLFIHGCSFSGAWDLQQHSCVNGPISGNQTWVKLPAPLPASASITTQYRLTVDSANGYGMHNYAVAICLHNSVPPNCQTSGATITGWNSAIVQLQGNSNSVTYTLATIPSDYAGRQISIALFNPGVGSGDTMVRIVPASTGVVTYPSYLRMVNTTSGVAIHTSYDGDSLYHGKWVQITAQLPTNYAGGTWQLVWTSDEESATNINTTAMTITVKSAGNIIALVK